VPYWHIRIPLLLQGGGKEKLILWEPKQLLGEMKVQVDFEVDTMIFDPFVRVLAKASVGGLNLNRVQKSAFELYPNPTKESFVVYARNPSVILLDVYDAVGQLVKQFNTNGNVVNQVRVSLSGMAAGTYFLRINDGSFVYSYKLIKN
jgi:hypothetical protein